ncbi:MAG: ankyrin repeat domain-containing protein [Alphaproteobacteria bacterium]
MSTTPHRHLSSSSSLENLRRQAKRWLKEIVSGDTEAIARFNARLPGRAEPKLREVQHALALDYGFANWAALKQALADQALAQRTPAERIAEFLEHSVVRYGMRPRAAKWEPGYEDRPSRWARAARVLERFPDIANDSIHTAVAAGDAVAVQRFLARDPKLANTPSPFDNWPPLLRLASVRMSIEAARTNGVAIARLLIDAGADAALYWTDGKNHFTLITCAIGHGEGGQPEHPQAVEFVRLLLDRGAEPFDGQVLYNTSLGADDTFWLDLLYAESEKRGETAKWLTQPRELGSPALDYLLGNAVNQRHAKRVEWLLARGAKAGTVNAYSKQAVMKLALLAGAADIADNLARHGAPQPQLSGLEAFQAAVMRGDIGEAKRLLGGHPDYLAHPGPMNAAIGQDRIDLVEALLGLGMSVDVHGKDGMRPLHQAAGEGRVAIAKLLIARGAEIDPFENRFGGVPLSWANHNRQPEALALLAPLSRNIRALCFSCSLDRLRELFTAEPELVNQPIRPNEPPIFCLPNDDDELAVEVAELLLSFGASVHVRNDAGLTPAESARKEGLEEAAALLEEAASG